MKPFFCKTAIALSLTLPAAANAAEYVCNVEGITVYASYQINDACRIVETNNVTENSVVAIPGDTPVLKTAQTTEFKASAADYVHASQATPAVQTPVVVARNEYGILAPISIPLAQTRQAVPANKTIADSVIVSNDTPAVETPAAQPAVPAIQIPQEIIQNSTAQPQTSTTQNSQAVTAQDEALDKTPAKVEAKREGKTYAKSSSQYKAKVTHTKAGKTVVIHASEEQAAKPIATASTEPSKPATITQVEHGKTTVPTPFPQAYKPASDILLDKGNNDSDIKILPNVPITSVTNTAEAANPRLNITLRNRQNKSRSSSYSKYKTPVIRTAPVVTPAPKPSPKENRKQILQTEVRNEQAAITRLQTQLNAAKQKGDQIKIQQLTRTINARKANIRAIQGEMSR
ncbi:TPA: hypothetical protein ACU8BY_001009 [Neisseria subflava]